MPELPNIRGTEYEPKTTGSFIYALVNGKSHAANAPSKALYDVELDDPAHSNLGMLILEA